MTTETTGIKFNTAQEMSHAIRNVADSLVAETRKAAVEPARIGLYASLIHQLATANALGHTETVLMLAEADLLDEATEAARA